MKLGIMGGTFNPPHNGHLSAARHARTQLKLDRVLFVPTNIPPHKKLPQGGANAAQRCEMVRLMLAGEQWAELSTAEVERGGASYTVDTLRMLHECGCWEEMFLIVGTDMLRSLAQWRQPAEICRLAAFAVVARKEGDRQEIKERARELWELYGADIRLIDCPALPVSSTELRGSSNARRFMPPEVARYIEDNCLYRQ